MKHSVRFIQVNYNKRGYGKNILFLRGMYIREWEYTPDNFSRIIESTKNRDLWDVQTFDNRITFERKYTVKG